MENKKYNILPGRSVLIHKVRQPFNFLRTKLVFLLKAKYVKYTGFIRVPFDIKIWSPNKDICLGNRVQFGKKCIIQCDIQFEDDILVAGNVSFVGRDDHKYDIIGQKIWDSGRGDSFKTIIEGDVWIGHGAIIVAGVRVGKGSIIAAGSVVVRDIEPFSIVGGNPARFIKSRFNEKELNKHLSKINI